MNKLINLLLLVAMSFSIAHAVVLDDAYEESHCSAKEYLSEFSQPVYHEEMHEHENDACDSHYMFHVSFLLPDIFTLLEINKKMFILNSEAFTHTYSFPNNTFRPPIV